jgi:NADPH2:quinone reductase
MRQLLAWCEDGTLRPHIGKIFPLEETAQAVAMLEERKAVGKIIVRP